MARTTLSASEPCFLRTRLVREPIPSEFSDYTTPLRGPADVYRVMSALYGDEPQEVFVVFLLNARNAIVGMQEVTRGLASASLVHPRETFRAAILANASGIIMSHNHPSGDPKPSSEDRAVTRQLADAGRVIGIPLVDHVVVGRGSYVSLADEIGT